MPARPRFTGTDFALAFDKNSRADHVLPLQGNATCWNAGRSPTSGAPPPTTTAARGRSSDPERRKTARSISNSGATRGRNGRSRNVQVQQVGRALGAHHGDGDLPAVDAAIHHDLHHVRHAATSIVECAYQPGARKLPMMPRFGTELVAAPGLENITWYGRGPAETHIDRQFERVGVYRSTVDKRVGRVLAPAGERQQNRRPLGGADQRAGQSACSPWARPR